MQTPVTSPKDAALGFVVFASAVAAIGGFLFGYDTAVINGANSYLTLAMHLTPSQEGSASASAILGCIPGAMCAGFLSDRWGRKRMLFVCAVLYAISGLLSAIPRTFDEFLLARFISGLGIGGSSMICPVYIAEIAPERWRGRLGTLFQLGIVVGIFLTLFINKIIQGVGDETWNIAFGWRWMLGMEVVPAVIFIFLLFRVPESPRWLLQKGRKAQARAILEKVAATKPMGAEVNELQTAIEQEDGRFSELFTGIYRRPLVLAVVLMACSQFCGINAVMYYSTTMFAATSMGRSAAFTSSIWIGFINVLFTFVAIALVDKAGRRPLLLIGTAVQTLALGAVGWMFHVGISALPLILAVMVFTAAFALALGPISWLFSSEIFPNRLRGRAMSIAAFTVWISCYLVAQTFPMLNDNPSIGPAATFWFYAGISLFSFLFVFAAIPETKGRTLEDIEQQWSRV